MGGYLKHESHQLDDQGRVMVTSKTYKIRVNTEPFYATFLKNTQMLYGLTSTQYQTLIYLCEKAHFDKGTVDITPADRKKMMALFDVSKGAISLSIKGLLQKKILSGSDGSYAINPDLFWKGNPIERDKLLKSKWFEITFKISDEDLPEELKID